MQDYNEVEGWVLDEHGMFYRQAARVVLFDKDGRVLLIRGHDADNPTRYWWFTVGGGLHTGEAPRQGAMREVQEETGISLTAEALKGPVLRRSALFDFMAGTRRQDEVFFIATLDSHHEVSQAGWTDAERQVLDEYRWWDMDDLDQAIAEGLCLYPRGLETRLREWKQGWDGHCEVLTED
ncbi:MAG: NUDIX domain-containing protein [Actinomycetaceae bacterium]|nr:NUDIX domain-containing protein [Actinomycetaceae bacterium]